jgi:hypothetical protein
MKAIWNFISSFIVIALFVWFIQWYIKGHFGKYFIFFWLNTIIALIMYLTNPGYNENWPQHDNRTGAEVWEQTYGK